MYSAALPSTVCPAGAVRTAAPASRRVALLVRATAAPPKPQAAATSKVDTTLTPKAQGFTMPGGCCCQLFRHDTLHAWHSYVLCRLRVIQPVLRYAIMA
jgi:hypothetical protein